MNILGVGCDLPHTYCLPLNILGPVPKVSTVELFKIFCFLFKFSFYVYKVCNACEELESNAKCSRFGRYFIDVKNAHIYYMNFDFVRIFHKV